MDDVTLEERATVTRSKRIEVPRCEVRTPARWYRPNGGRCPYEAHHVLDGEHLCNLHTKLWVRGEGAAEARGEGE